MPDSISKKILLVPLDWGLGHTTRCIPVIRVLLALGYKMHIGGTNITNAILQEEFPELIYHDYPSYGVSYPKDGKKFLQRILRLSPSIAKVVRKEKRITNVLHRQYDFDTIISDNRFGVRARGCKNIFISHQLNLSVPQSSLAQFVANYINHKFINKFDKVGVPDWKDHILSGKLSNHRGIKVPVIFLGALSRWSFKESQDAKGVLAILSGPEPQRTLLEELLICQSAKLSDPLTIVRAKPHEHEIPVANNIIFYNHLSASELQNLVLRSEVIISRAGYTTILDLIAIQKNGILIPTPGQTEQEYLAQHLYSMNLFSFYKQQEIDIAQAIGDYRKKQWNSFPEMDHKLEEKIEELIA